MEKKKSFAIIHALFFVYFHTLLSIIFSSAIETLTCRRESSLIGTTSFRFAQKTIHDFQNTVLNLQWHCLRTNTTTIITIYMDEIKNNNSVCDCVSFLMHI